MSIITFPLDPSNGQHYVTENRLWVYSESKDIWELWGNLQYVPVPGAPGDPGTSGNPGDTGSQGSRGQKGEKGETGEQGEQGEIGPPGTGITLVGTVDTEGELYKDITPISENGDVWIVVKPEGGKQDYFGFVYNEDNVATGADPSDYWNEVGPIRGPIGPDGQKGDTGQDGNPGKDGAPGAPGLNGAHGGAFCHTVSVPPTRGPQGKLYLYTPDNSIYVTL